MRLPGLQKQTKYYFAIKSSDRYDNVSAISNVLEVSTTDAPYFKESTREVFFDLDVTQSTVQSQTIQFSNIGEGLVYWASETLNNSELWINIADWEQETEALATEAAANPQLYQASQPYLESETVSLKSTGKEHFLNDNTMATDGQSYETGNGFYDLVGSGTPNAGLIYGTRFKGPINLTHVEMALYPTQKEWPVRIEIKRGSETIKNAKTVLVQEYYVDTTNVMSFFKVPLYEPQNMYEDENFWVVLHFPKEEPYPLVIEKNAPYYEGAFMISTNNGYTYNEAYHTIGYNRVPLVRALTSGKDGAFAFIDPTSGSIKGGETKDVKITVDAEYLSNGKHMATLSLYTTDMYKPGVAIDVKVQVSGQEPAFKAEDMYTFDVHANVEKLLNFDVINSGYDTLVVRDVNDNNGYYTKAFADSLVILPKQKVSIPLNYLTTQTGIYNEDITVITNIGNQLMAAQIRSAEAPTMSVTSASPISIEVPYDGTAEILVDVSNTGTGSVLEYDIDEYNASRVYGGYMANGQSYSIKSSNDVDGPAENLWEEIEPFAITYPQKYFFTREFPFEKAFPFFNGQLTKMRIDRDGTLFSDGRDESANRTASDFTTIDCKDANVFFKDVYYHDFGDRRVFTLVTYLADKEYEAEKDIYTQVVFFSDGAIEYRYKDVDAIINNNLNNCNIQLSGFNTADTLVYARYDDGQQVLKNGLVVRFEPTTDLNVISTYETSGSITKGQTKQLAFKVEPSKLGAPAGTYSNAIRVKANTPDNYQDIPAEITINGMADLTVADTLSFEMVKTGQSAVAYLEVQNLGSDAAIINNGDIVFGYAQFAVESQLPMELPPFSSQMIKVAFTPTVASNLLTSAIINFSNGQTGSCVISATGKIDPVMTNTLPSSVVEEVNAGETISVPFSIAASAADLEYSFKNSVFAHAVRADQKMGEGKITEDLTGSYGYNWQEGEINGAYHKWDDLKDYADTDTLFISQGGQFTLDLGFEFPYYGETFDTIWVSKNGYVTPVFPQSDIVGLNFKKDDGIQGMIGPHISNMVPANSKDGVLLRQLNDRVFLQWDNFISDGYYTSAPVTFQLELVEDGSFFFHYKDVDRWDAPLNYGIESPDESEYIEPERSIAITKNNKTIFDNMTLALTPPSNGVVNEGETINFDLQLTADAFYANGVYKDTLVLYTGSQQEPIKKVPVQMTVVNGVGNIMAPAEVEAAQVIFKDGVTTNARAQQVILLTNKGRGSASISKIPNEALEGFELFDTNGNAIVKSSSGILAQPIQVKPWETDTLRVQVPVTALQDINGQLHFEGNFETVSTQFIASVVPSPEFSWTAVDQNIDMLNSDEYKYTFSISNSGTTDLDYKLLPTVKSKLPEGEYPGEITEIVPITYEQPFTLDSVALDRKEAPDAYHSPGTKMLYSNHFSAPEGGMLITHVKVNLNLENPDKLLGLQIAVNGELPERGKLWSRKQNESITDLTPATFAYEQRYKAPEAIKDEWIIMPLTQPVQILEGEDFWVTIDYPGTDLARSGHSLGYDVALNESTLDSTIYGLERDYFDFGVSWSHNDMGKVWKIRPLSAIGDNGQWLTAEPIDGTIAGGESLDITTTVVGDFANKGEHEGQLIVLTNDVENTTDRISYNISVNGYPELVYKPNSYKDTLRMVETESQILNYIFEDPEGDAISFSMSEIDNDSIKVITESTTANSAKVKVVTNYKSDGLYEIPVSISDAAGNVLADTIRFEVKDLNRTPYLNPELKTIKLNLADPDPMTIDINELFIDPDGDDLYLQAGNTTQAVLDMALGYDYITLHPKAEGLGLLVFAANDGKENGYKFDYIYVTVSNNPDAVPSQLNGFEGNQQLMEQLEQGAVITPNLINKGESSQVLFKLDEAANVRLELYNMQGQCIHSYINTERAEGLNQEQIDFSTLSSGMYLCRFVMNNQVTSTVKIIVK